MSILAWVAVLAAAWFTASLVTAVVMGRYLRRADDGVVGDDELRPLDTGPMRIWLRDFDVPSPRPGAEDRAGGLRPPGDRREPAA